MEMIKAKIRKFYRRLAGSDTGGFSILEMLLAVVILLLATQLVAQSMKLASEHYIESTNRSKAQMIVSTLSDFVRSELTMASDVVVAGGEVSFIDGSARLGGRCTLGLDGHTLCLRNNKTGKAYYPIVGSKNGAACEYANGLYVSSFSLDYSGGTDSEGTFTYYIAVSDNKGRELASGKYAVNGSVLDTND